MKHTAKILEILFWFLNLVISFFFIQVHGFHLVGDGYFEHTHVFYYLMFGGEKPSELAFQIWQERSIFLRPLYPFISALFARLFSFYFELTISIYIAMIFVNIIAGFFTLFFFSKLIVFISNSEITRQMGRLLLGSIPTFVVYWLKHTTDIFFLLPFSIALLFLFKYEREPENFKFLVYFCFFAGLSVLVREFGILLFLSCIPILFRRNPKFASKLILFGFILVFLLYNIIFWDTLILTRGRYIYFHQKIYPTEDSEYPTFVYSQIPNWIVLSIRTLFIDPIIPIFFSALWAFGFMSIYWSFSFFSKISKDILPDFSKRLGISPIHFQIRKNILWSFCICYFLFLWLDQGVHISERYFLPLTLCVVIFYLKGIENFEIEKRKQFIFIGCAINLIILLIRLAVIYIFSLS